MSKRWEWFHRAEAAWSLFSPTLYWLYGAVTGGGSLTFITNYFGLPLWQASLIGGQLAFLIFAFGYIWRRHKELSPTSNKLVVPREESVSQQASTSAKQDEVAKSSKTLETATAQLDTVTKRLEKKEAEIKSLSSELLSVKAQWGKWRIRFIGMDSKPRNLSVAVQFLALEDSELAEQIRGHFVDMVLEPAWEPEREIEQIKWRRNPSGSSKVVIFPNLVISDGLKAAFNDCELIPAKVAVCSKEVEMLADLTIVVFPSDGSTH